jgi:hypothetical protein
VKIDFDYVSAEIRQLAERANKEGMPEKEFIVLLLQVFADFAKNSSYYFEKKE